MFSSSYIRVRVIFKFVVFTGLYRMYEKEIDDNTYFGFKYFCIFQNTEILGRIWLSVFYLWSIIIFKKQTKLN